MTGFLGATEESDRQALECLEALTKYLKPLLEAHATGRTEKDDLLGAVGSAPGSRATGSPRTRSSSAPWS